MNQTVEEENVESLLVSVRAGEPGSFERLLSLYESLVTSVAASFGGDFGVMKQEATIALYRAASAYRSGFGTTFGLFAKICIRKALISVLRRDKATDTDPLDEETDEKIENHFGDPSVSLIDSENVDEFYRNCHDLLSSFEFQIVILRIDGYSNQQIAAMLNKSEKSVSNAFTRATGKMKKSGRF